MSLTILLAAFQVTTSAAPLSEPPPVPAAERLAAVREVLTTEERRRTSCQNARLQTAVGPVQPKTDDLVYRQSDNVRGWLLLERSVDGCSIPISLPHSAGASEVPANPAAASGQ